MSNLQVFQNSEFGEVRVVEVNGEGWLVGKDVALALGYTNTNKAIADHVDEDDLTKRYPIVDSLGRTQEVTLINESGLYSLVLGSKLPTAKQFKRWVTSEVLPTIRKHGGYLTPEKIEEVLLNPDTIIKLATDLKKERERRELLEAKIEQDKPKTIFADAVSVSHTSILVGDLAKLIKQNGYDIGQKRLFKYLRENGYLMKFGSSRNMPTQRAMEMGLFEIKETTINNPDGSIRITKTPKVTGKGQIYFINHFLQRGA